MTTLPLPILRPAIVSDPALVSLHLLIFLVCTKRIHGVRYKCMHADCPDFDLCSVCESHPIALHPDSHPLLKMKTPESIIPQVGHYKHSASAVVANRSRESMSFQNTPRSPDQLASGSGDLGMDHLNRKILTNKGLWVDRCLSLAWMKFHPRLAALFLLLHRGHVLSLSRLDPPGRSELAIL